jgi:hypothetical protein
MDVAEVRVRLRVTRVPFGFAQGRLSTSFGRGLTSLRMTGRFDVRRCCRVRERGELAVVHYRLVGRL